MPPRATAAPADLPDAGAAAADGLNEAVLVRFDRYLSRRASVLRRHQQCSAAGVQKGAGLTRQVDWVLSGWRIESPYCQHTLCGELAGSRFGDGRVSQIHYRGLTMCEACLEMTGRLSKAGSAVVR